MFPVIISFESPSNRIYDSELLHCSCTGNSHPALSLGSFLPIPSTTRRVKSCVVLHRQLPANLSTVHNLNCLPAHPLSSGPVHLASDSWLSESPNHIPW